MNKALNYNIDKEWVDWAIQMIEAGYESESLYILAGITEPYNQFELRNLTDKVLQELDLDYSNRSKVIENYIYYLISRAIDNKALFFETLKEIKDICIDLKLPKEYMNFYLLYFAKDDLQKAPIQWYWEGANRENIDDIIKQEFKNWNTQFERKQEINSRN